MDLKLVWDVNAVAAYAAIVSTVVLVWDVIKWWHGGAAFRISATPNMKVAGGIVEDHGTYMVIRVYNVGSVNTTVTHVVILAYKTRLHRLFRRKPIHAAIVPRPDPQPVPFGLKPGEEFLAKFDQGDQIVGWSRHYALYTGICHTLSKRDLVAYVKPIVTTPD